MRIISLLRIGLIAGLFACQTSRNTEELHLQMYDTDAFEGSHKPKVSVLGTFHFSNAAVHDYQDQYTIDASSEKRQQELTGLIERLQKFRPTKILIEANRITNDSILNAEYLRYLGGEIFDANDEHYQIAFPLAKALGHNKIFCSDATADWFGADLDWENFDEERYLRSVNQYEKANRYDYEKVYAVEDSLKSTMPLVDYFKLINSPEAQLYSHQIYLTETVLSGAGDNYIGADAVARWYRRNLRIFSNLLDIVSFDQPERILVLYGASHTWTLKQFLMDSPDFDYVEVNTIIAAE